MQLLKVRDENDFEFYLDREGNPYAYLVLRPEENEDSETEKKLKS